MLYSIQEQAKVIFDYTNKKNCFLLVWAIDWVGPEEIYSEIGMFYNLSSGYMAVYISKKLSTFTIKICAFYSM